MATGLNITEIKLVCEVSSRQISDPVKDYCSLNPVNIILILKALVSIYTVPSARLSIIKGKYLIWPTANSKLTETASHKRDPGHIIKYKITHSDD